MSSIEIILFALLGGIAGALVGYWAYNKKIKEERENSRANMASVSSDM